MSNQDPQERAAGEAGTSTAFTPGPWTVTWTDAFGSFYVEDGKDCVIAKRGPWHHNAAASLANARLIAAAPDLYAELARMVEHFGAWANDHSDEATAETWAALHCARAALSKVESR